MDYNLNQQPPSQPPQARHISTLIGLIIIIAVAIIIFSSIFAYQYFATPKASNQSQNPVACTMEAKVCPDGSFVGRTGPNCEFSACPAVQDTTAGWKTYTNSQYGFEIKYPSTVALTENNETTTWYGGVDQVTVKSVVTISTPNATARNAFVSFYVAIGNNAIKNCYKQNLNGQASEITKIQQINGTTFHVTNFEDSAMGGQRDNVTQYSALKDNVCYFLQGNATWRDVQFVLGATDGKQATQQELDEQNKKIQDEQNFVDSIISTFKFTK